ERGRVEGAELEDVAELDRRLLAELAAALGACVARIRLADVGEARVVVAPGLNPAQVPPVAVRAGDELTLAQRLVGNNVDRHPDRAQRPPAGAVDGPDLLV